MSRLSASSVVVVFLAATLSARAREVPIVEVAGDCADVFQGQVCTWARMQGDKTVDLGVTVPIASIENAPPDAAMVWPPAPVAVLKLPAAAQQQTGLTDLTMYWEAMGHPPGPYMTPHFDFHINAIPDTDRLAIDCSDVSKPSALPVGYSLTDVTLPPEMAKMIGVSTLVGTCVPKMGMHALPPEDVKLTTLFEKTLVVGYYAGKPIFLEPMITKATLLKASSFDLTVPAVPGADGYPKTFRAEYDAQHRAYRFVFGGFATGS
jgi:hypothetical protein